MFLTEISASYFELHPMVVTLNTLIESPPLTADYEHLKRCWESQADPHPKMSADWDEIGMMVYSPSLSRSVPSSVESETNRLERLVILAKNIYSRLCKFKSDYAEFMDDSRIVSLDKFIKASYSRVQSAGGSQYFYRADISNDNLEKLKLIRRGIDLYGKSLLTNFSCQYDLVRLDMISTDGYEDAFNSLKTFLVYVHVLADKLVASERGFGRLSEMRPLQKYIKDMTMSLISEIGHFSGKEESLDYFLSEYEGNLIVLENQSAEAKAIQRIQSTINEDDWILVSNPNEEIDVDYLDSQLRACGYIN
jgi:hypothetical protein